MGKQIYLRKIESLFENSSVVDIDSIKRIVMDKSVNNKNSNYAKLLIFNLIAQGKIKKVGRGLYTKYNESSLSVFSFKPAYLGLQSAISHLGLYEQETIPIILTTRSIRRGIRKVLGANILVRKISKKHFFGFSFNKEGSFYLPYSDIEKTFIDMTVFKENISYELLKVFKKKINKIKLKKYLKNYSDRTYHAVLTKLS